MVIEIIDFNPIIIINLKYNDDMKNKINLIAIALVCIGAMSMIKTEKSLKALSSDSYKVIKVNGKIVFIKTKSSMKQGDVYVDGTPINFASDQSRAAIINKLKGRCVLTPAKKGQAKVLPATNNIASRSGALINKIDLQNHFSGNYLVIGKMELEISEKSFPQDEKHFFYLAYEYNKELIRKKLPSNGNKLILNKDEIFMIDNESVPAQKIEMALYYMDNGSGAKLAEFTPVFPELTNLKSEVEIIMGEYADKANDVKVKEITAYLNEFYGKPQKDNLKMWLASEFSPNE